MYESTENIENNQIRSVLSEVLPGVVLRKMRKQLEKENLQSDLVLDVQFHSLEFSLVIEVINQSGISSARLRDRINRVRDYVEWYQQNAVPMVVAHYFSPCHQEILRESNISFVDLSGNAFIRYESINVDRRGFRNKYKEERVVKDPFSDKASLILRLLLESKRSWGIRELASEVHLSPGYASKVISRIKELGYVVKSEEGIQVRDAKAILDDWIVDYGKKLKAREKIRKYFCQASGPIEVMSKMASIQDFPAGVHYALSHHAGAHLIQPYASFEVVDIYASDLQMQDFFKQKLRLRRVNQGENVRFRSHMYKESVFYGSRIIDGLQVVSDLQLYLDLYNYPVRGFEQAEKIYNKQLRLFIER